MEDGDDVVIPVFAEVTDGQMQVDLARPPDPDPPRHPMQPSCHVLTRESASAFASAIRMNASTSSISPRRIGSTPAARSNSSDRTGDPAQPANAALNVLRRWANAASMTAKTARLSPVRETSCRSMATRAESTPGTGQKTDRETDPARLAVPYQATLALGDP